MKKLLTLAILASTLLLSGCWETAKGEKIGNIVKVSQEGAVCKTYEAEIIRGGLNGGTGSNGTAFFFTIENSEMAKQLQDAMEAQKEVKIRYHSEMNSWCRSNSGDHFLDSFEIIDHSKTGEPNTAKQDVTKSVTIDDRQHIMMELLANQQRLMELLVQGQK